jgi:hypothetical protein
VALYVKPGEDFHWYRKNDNGSWSHKLAQLPATTKDFSGVEIGNSLVGDDTDGYIFCEYMCTPAPCALEIYRRRRRLETTISNEFFEIQILARAGVFNPGWNPDATETASIQERLEGLTTEVPDPEWPVQSGYSGFAMTSSPTLRVWAGFIQTNGTYFADVNDLETYLIGRAIARGFGDEVPVLV